MRLKLPKITKTHVFSQYFTKFPYAIAAASNVPPLHSPRIDVGLAQATQLYYCSTTHQGNEDSAVSIPFAKSLASIVVESSSSDDVKGSSKPQLSRVATKRLLELRVKKRVKQHYLNGKFYDVFQKVVADPKTLLDAYNCLRVNSNVDVWACESGSFCFESLADELVNGEFDVSANTFSVSSRGRGRKEVLVLPNVKLKVVQEAMRMVLEVVFKPHFSKISHGGRSGRGRSSALKFVCKEVVDPDWWFTVHVVKKLDSLVLSKLILALQDKIEDSHLCEMIQSMFDAQVLNLEFGGFPKGQGLPQEGVLSPILMNIYLDLFDGEFSRMSMRYEALDLGSVLDKKQPQSKLRDWFRRQIRSNSDNFKGSVDSGVRVYCCRFMDEIFFAISGCRDAALSLKFEVQNYFQNILHLDVTSHPEIIPCNNRCSIQFAGTLVVRTVRDSPAVRVVHKLKEKVILFALQKQAIWDAGTVRIGKKWLAHGLKKVKESEIKQLSDENSLLSKISKYRKAGMETDHWYKQLIKIWMQDVKSEAASSREYLLAKYIAEPSLPPTLRASFYEFQKRVEEYNSSEIESLHSLLPGSGLSQQCTIITKTKVPINLVKKSLVRYGMVSIKGHACAIPVLILQDSSAIIDWFSGIVYRWLRWYAECDNLGDLKLIISDQVRKSCIRTLALKYRMHESEIEKCFASELSRIPFSRDIDHGICEEALDSCAFDSDEGLMYGISYGGSSQLSLVRMVSQSRPCNCFIVGCSHPAPCVYMLQVMEKQQFPGWNTGFSSCIHPSLNRRRIGLCKQHLKDLYLGTISLQAIDFGSWK